MKVVANLECVMLVLTLSQTEGARLALPDGREILVVAVGHGGGQVKIGFEAPKDVGIHRVANTPPRNKTLGVRS